MNNGAAAAQLFGPLMGKMNTGQNMEQQQLAKLEESTKDFESVFTGKLLEVMRKTISKTGFIDGGRAENIFTGMLDDELAKMIAETGSLGLGKMMFKQMLEQLYPGSPVQDGKIVPFRNNGLMPDGKLGVDIKAELLPNSTLGEMLEPETGEGEEIIDDLLPEEAKSGEKNTKSVREQLGPLTQDIEEDVDLDLEFKQVRNTGRNLAGTNTAAGEADEQEIKPNSEQTAEKIKPELRTQLRTHEGNNIERSHKADSKQQAEQVQITDADGDEQVAKPQVKAAEKAEAKGVTAQQHEGAVKQDLVDTAMKKEELSKQTVEKTNQVVNNTDKLAIDVDDENEKLTSDVRSRLALLERVRQLTGRYQETETSDAKTAFANRIQQKFADSAALHTSQHGGEEKGAASGEESERVAIVNDARDGVRSERIFVTPPLVEQSSVEGGDNSDTNESNNKVDIQQVSDKSLQFKRMELLSRSEQKQTVHQMFKDAAEPTKIINQIVRKAELLLKNGISEMKIELEPKHLGHVKISIVMENDVLTTRIHAHSSEVGEIIKANLSQLGDTLKDMGYQTNNFDVSSGDQEGQNAKGNDTSESDQNGSFSDIMGEFGEDTNGVATEAVLENVTSDKGIYAFDVMA